MSLFRLFRRFPALLLGAVIAAAPGLAGCKARCRVGTMLHNGSCVASSTQGNTAPIDGGTVESDAAASKRDEPRQDSMESAGSAAAGLESSGTSGVAGASANAVAAPAAGSGGAVVHTTATAGGSGSVAPACGNGVLEAGELCEGAGCPVECGAQNSCLFNRLVGSASTCDAHCVADMIENCSHGDGCCAANCTYENDKDCSPSCGDGVVTTGERCERGSQDRPCPTTPAECDDNDACTADMLIGTAAQCSAECLNAPITAPKNGDRCCPSSANASNDNDCETRCGDGVATGDETCDGNCRTSCAPPRGCAQEVLTGSPSSCNVSCMAVVVNRAINNDGCCPPGGLRSDDNDCTDECNSAADCQGRPGECSRIACRSGSCETEPLSAGTACGGGGSCDGDGECVEPPKPTEDLARCQSASDCTGAGQQCSMGRCITSCNSNTSESCRLTGGVAGHCVSNICVPDCERNASTCSRYGLQCKAYDKCGCFMVCDVWGGLDDPMTCDSPCP